MPRPAQSGAVGRVGRSQPVVSGITVHLQDAAKALQDPFGMLPAATGRVCKGNSWRRIAAPGPVIAGQRPEVSGLCLLGPRVEHRGAGLVHEEFRRPFQVSHQGIEDRAQLKSGTADPICQGGPIEINALAAVDLRLPIEGQVIGVFGSPEHARPSLRWACHPGSTAPVRAPEPHHRCRTGTHTSGGG